MFEVLGMLVQVYENKNTRSLWEHNLWIILVCEFNVQASQQQAEARNIG